MSRCGRLGRISSLPGRWRDQRSSKMAFSSKMVFINFLSVFPLVDTCPFFQTPSKYPNPHPGESAMVRDTLQFIQGKKKENKKIFVFTVLMSQKLHRRATNLVLSSLRTGTVAICHHRAQPKVRRWLMSNKSFKPLEEIKCHGRAGDPGAVPKNVSGFMRSRTGKTGVGQGLCYQTVGGVEVGESNEQSRCLPSLVLQSTGATW